MLNRRVCVANSELPSAGHWLALAVSGRTNAWVLILTADLTLVAKVCSCGCRDHFQVSALRHTLAYKTAQDSVPSGCLQESPFTLSNVCNDNCTWLLRLRGKGKQQV